MRKKSNASRRVSEEAVAEIIVRAEVNRTNRERAEYEVSTKVEAETK